MHCLVTGAAGFVGSSLCDRLLADGHSVVGLDCFVDYYPRAMKERNLVAARSHKNFRFVEANLLGANQTSAAATLDPLLKNVEVVFHQAAQAGVRASWGTTFQSYTDNNILGTQQLLEAIRRSSSVKKVVYASSSSVYGDAESFPTAETVTPRPVSPYGVSKLAAEHLMVLYAKEFKVPTVSLRYFTVFGPRQRPDMAFHRFIRSGLTKEALSLFGDGEQSRDFTFISDIVEANLLAAERGPAGSVFNVGGGVQATVNEVLTIISSLVGPLTINRLERQAGDARHTSADTTKAREILGFNPKVKLHEGIALEAEWLRGELSL
jgi:nucleoside-diphosphate-sugar epimerase